MTQTAQYSDPLPIPAGRRVKGEVTVPSSKSVTHRFYNLALLGEVATTISRPLVAEDTELFKSALERCGFTVESEGSSVRLEPRSAMTPAEVVIDCGNAGTLFRFLLASLCTRRGRFVLDGKPRLRERPVGSLIEALRQLGAKITCHEDEGYCPLTVEGGHLRGGTVRLEAGQSSQFLSAVLMAATRARSSVTVEVRSLVSSPYVDLTLQAMREFGASVDVRGGCFRVEPARLEGGVHRVEGDYSAAAYPAAAAAITSGEVLLHGLEPRSAQGDRRFLDILARAGAQVDFVAGGIHVRGGPLKAVDEDLSGLPDQVPTLAALAVFATGSTAIRNVEHLRIKESDRLRATARELTRLGAAVEESKDSLVVHGGLTSAAIEPVVVETYDDHRIAMAMALVGLRRPGVAIAHPEVVAKSYPSFWSDLAGLLEA